MKSKLLYLRAWLIIKRKQFLSLFPAKEKRFTKFSIVCAPRSGSTWLHTLLNSHPQIFSYGEILRENHEGNPNKESPSVHEFVFHPHHSSIEAVGLKVFYEYETAGPFKKPFQEIINDNTICILHLIREDKTAQFKSLKHAEASQVWSSGKPPSKLQSIETDPDELEVYKKNLFQNELHIEKIFQHHSLLTIRYEDLQKQTETKCVEIQKFLQVKPRKLFSLLRKQSG